MAKRKKNGEQSKTASEKNLPSAASAAITSAAIENARIVLLRRRAARSTRKRALARHAAPITVRAEVTRFSLTAAKAPVATVSDSITAGYLLAAGDSWFDYLIHDVLTKLDDLYGYNIESAAHKGDPIEALVSHVGQLDKFDRKSRRFTEGYLDFRRGRRHRRR